MGAKFEEYELCKKLLDSLPDTWSIPCMLIKNTTPDLKSKTLNDIICLLDEGSSGSKSEKGKSCCNSEHSAGGRGKATGQIPEDQIALFGAFMSSYDALVTGKLQPAVHDVEDLVKINPDDLEYMDFGLKLIEMIEEDEKSKKAPTALMLKQLSNCEWETEIEDAEDEFDEAMMAEIEVSEKAAERESECDFKADNKGKGKAAADDVDTSSKSEVTCEDEYYICSANCVDKMQNYHAANTFLIGENDKLKRVNKELKQNEVMYTRKIKALLKDNVTFKDNLDKKDVLIKDLSDKLIASETNLIKERILIAKWKMQRNVLDECVNKQRKVYIKDGLGYNKVPHPDNFVPFPE
ncbi:hypothetical protein L1987_18982 [Smallanthus sonchifolius]|uniref:Uncharacterized protein n=1 Tax=Smallanthus sonchifolius TaxID=185202 RepID=A0ACB9J3F9_9ASTR|nr:hypothetical protein L1987_18982 [Smallanthus sonchifolius]